MNPIAAIFYLGRVNFKGNLSPDPIWIIEPAQTFAVRTMSSAMQSICSHKQVTQVVPIEIYNPRDEPVQIMKDTTLGLISPTGLEAGLEPLRVHKVMETVK